MPVFFFHLRLIEWTTTAIQLRGHGWSHGVEKWSGGHGGLRVAGIDALANDSQPLNNHSPMLQTGWGQLFVIEVEKELSSLVVDTDHD